MRFASFQSGGFITVKVVNPLERKQAKRTSVCSVVHDLHLFQFEVLQLLSAEHCSMKVPCFDLPVLKTNGL